MSFLRNSIYVGKFLFYFLPSQRRYNTAVLKVDLSGPATARKVVVVSDCLGGRLVVAYSFERGS